MILSFIHSPKSTKLNLFKTSLTFFILILTVSTGSYGQAPGFMGKRFLIGFEAPMIAGFDFFDRSNDYTYYEVTSKNELKPIDHDYSKFYYKVKPTLSLEYVFNRKSSVQVFGRFFKSKNDITNYYTEIAGSTYNFYPKGRVAIQSNSFGLKYKLIRGSGINPVGKYYTFGLERVFSKYLLDDDHFAAKTDFNEVIFQNPAVTKTSTWAFTFGFGSQQPLSKNLLFIFGAEIGMPFSWFTKISGSGIDTDWAENNRKTNYSRSYLFNINIGLALMP